MSQYLRDSHNFYYKKYKEMASANIVYDMLLSEKEQLVKDINNCKSIINKLKILDNVVTNKLAEYSQTMREQLEEFIQYGVNKVSPTKEYKVILKPYKFRSKNILKLYLIDTKGRYLPPKILEGDMLNQVLSFCAVVIISYRNGCETIYYDEAFASANPRSQIIIRDLINDYTKLGIKFVFVSQSPILLAGLSRHIIELVSQNNSIKEIKEYDVEAEDYNMVNDDYIIHILDELSKGGLAYGINES